MQVALCTMCLPLKSLLRYFGGIGGGELLSVLYRFLLNKPDGSGNTFCSVISTKNEEKSVN